MQDLKVLFSFTIYGMWWYYPHTARILQPYSLVMIQNTSSMSMTPSSPLKSLNLAWFLANAMDTVKRRTRARRKCMFTSQKNVNAERKTSSKLELFSVSFESNYAVALVLFFVCFWINKTKQNRTNNKNKTCASFLNIM